VRASLASPAPRELIRRTGDTGDARLPPSTGGPLVLFGLPIGDCQDCVAQRVGAFCSQIIFPSGNLLACVLKILIIIILILIIMVIIIIIIIIIMGSPRILPHNNNIIVITRFQSED
jgi:hypothetical protein